MHNMHSSPKFHVCAWITGPTHHPWQNHCGYHYFYVWHPHRRSPCFLKITGSRAGFDTTDRWCSLRGIPCWYKIPHYQFHQHANLQPSRPFTKYIWPNHAPQDFWTGGYCKEKYIPSPLPYSRCLWNLEELLEFSKLSGTPISQAHAINIYYVVLY